MKWTKQTKTDRCRENLAHTKPSRPDSGLDLQSVNVAHTKQSRPDSGLVFQTKVLNPDALGVRAQPDGDISLKAIVEPLTT